MGFPILVGVFGGLGLVISVAFTFRALPLLSFIKRLKYAQVRDLDDSITKSETGATAFCCVAFSILAVFSTVVLYPADVELRILRENGDDSEDSDTIPGLEGLTYSVLVVTWTVIYWSSQFISQACSFTFSFIRSGFLSFASRLRSVATTWLMWRVLGGVVGAIFILSYQLSGSGDGISTGRLILGYVQAVLNAIGMVKVIVYLGTGMVVVPASFLRFIGNKDMRENRLLLTIWRKEQKLDACMERWRLAQQEIQEALDDIPSGHALRPLFQALIEDPFAEMSLPSKPKTYTTSGDSSVPLLRKAAHKQRDKDRWKMECKLANCRKKFQIITWDREGAEEDLVDAEMQLLHSRSLPPWKSVVFAILGGIAWVATTSLSLVLLWCETVAVAIPDRSSSAHVLSHFVNAERSLPYAAYLVCFIPLAYMCTCLFAAVFSMNNRLLHLYPVRFDHNSEVSSVLAFAGTSLSLVLPLCINYSLLLKSPEDSDASGLAYENIYGNMESVPFFGKEFINWIPILLWVVVVSSVLNLPRRIRDKLSGRNLEQEAMALNRLRRQMESREWEHIRDKARAQVSDVKPSEDVESSGLASVPGDEAETTPKARPMSDKERRKSARMSKILKSAIIPALDLGKAVARGVTDTIGITDSKQRRHSIVEEDIAEESSFVNHETVDRLLDGTFQKIDLSQEEDSAPINDSQWNQLVAGEIVSRKARVGWNKRALHMTADRSCLTYEKLKDGKLKKKRLKRIPFSTVTRVSSNQLKRTISIDSSVLVPGDVKGKSKKSRFRFLHSYSANLWIRALRERVPQCGGSLG